jgi:predicted phosphodiesterase
MWKIRSKFMRVKGNFDRGVRLRRSRGKANGEQEAPQNRRKIAVTHGDPSYIKEEQEAEKQHFYIRLAALANSLAEADWQLRPDWWSG